MRYLKIISVIVLFTGLLESGCSLNALREELIGETSTQKEPVAQKEPSKEIQAPNSEKMIQTPKKQSELELIPKIDLVTMMNGRGSSISYFSSAKLPKIINFYRDEMKKLGWKEGKALTDNKNYANLRFLKNKELTTISLGADSTSKPPRVMVSIVPHGSLKASSLPRYPGSKEVFDDHFTAMYVTTDKVTKVHEWTLNELKKTGWLEREKTIDTGDDIMSALEKGDIELDVRVVIAPAQGNKTAIQYNIRKKL